MQLTKWIENKSDCWWNLWYIRLWQLNSDGYPNIYSWHSEGNDHAKIIAIILFISIILFLTRSQNVELTILEIGFE